MSEHETHRLALPGDLGEVLLEYRGEHHMGAEDVRIVLPFAVEGWREFTSTNGCAFVSADRRFVFLHDATVLLRIDLATHATEHLVPPPERYFAGFTERGDRLDAELYDADGGRSRLLVGCSDPAFRPGLGPVAHGRFPSAFP